MFGGTFKIRINKNGKITFVFLLYHTLCPISKMQIKYLFYLTVFCRAAENMMNYYNQCLFIKLCGKKRNPLKVGNYRAI